MQVLTMCVLGMWSVTSGTSPSASADLDNVKGLLASNVHSRTTKRRYRPIYHLTSPYGWLSDPAAFVYFKHKFHLFYQYHPSEGSWGPMHWGHAVSDDLVDWAHYPPALMPGDTYDQLGCFAGSAVVHDEYLALYYTGHSAVGNDTFNTINIAISADGIIFQKYLYNPVIPEVPPGITDFRNPKVWHHRQTWYMLVGASKKSLGRLLLYTSPDLYRWRLNRTVAKSFGDMGYMWESPDIFKIATDTVLLMSVQGLLPELGRFKNFKNLQVSGYVINQFDYQALQFDELEVSLSTFYELDHGHDFYAAKTALSPDGRRLMVAWLGMWESSFRESKNGWAGMISLARELSLSNTGLLLQQPVREVFDLREEILEDGNYSPGEGFRTTSRSFEMLVNVSSAVYDVGFALEWLDKEYTVAYSAMEGFVTVNRNDDDNDGKDGERRARWTPLGPLSFRVFVDHSTVELFCGNGEVVFSSRIYPTKFIYIRIGGEADVHIRQYQLRSSVGYDDHVQNYLANSLASKKKT